MKKKYIYLFLFFVVYILSFTASGINHNDISKEKQNNNLIIKQTLQKKEQNLRVFKDDFEMKSPKLLKAQEELKNSDNNIDKTPKTLMHVLLMYIPNRIMDLTDIVTLGLGFGPEASCEVVATEYFQFSAAYGDRYFIEKGYNRQYGGGYYSGHRVGYVCWKNEISATDYTFGYVEPYVVLQNGYNIPDYEYKPYSNGIRDFWRIGLHLGWIVDLSLSIHPVAIANFFTGFFFIRLTDTEEI